jgi:hypothetical protein
MDSSTPNGSHQQEGQNGTFFNYGFDPTQEYTLANDSLGNGDFLFDASNLFSQNPEQPPAFTHQPIMSDSSWSQNALHQSSDSSIGNYSSVQPTYQNQPYTQPAFELRQFAPTYDPRTVPRPSHSPSPYSNYQFQGHMGYAGGNPGLAPSQPFHQQPSLTQQRSPSLHTTAFLPEQPHNPYFGYHARPGIQQNLQVRLCTHEVVEEMVLKL